MRLRVYAVYDKAVQAFLSPMVFRSDGEAKRSFCDALAASESQISRHKQDYAFAFIGLYDDNLGTFICETSPTIVLEGATALASLNSPEE